MNEAVVKPKGAFQIARMVGIHWRSALWFVAISISQNHLNQAPREFDSATCILVDSVNGPLYADIEGVTMVYDFTPEKVSFLSRLVQG